MNFIKEHKLSVLIILISILGIILLNVFKDDESSNRFMVGKYLNSYGFELVSEDTDLYSKRLSTLDINSYSKVQTGECDYLYFKLSDMILRESLLKKDGNVSKSYNGEYSYSDNLLSYSYEIDVEGSYLMVSGYYNKEKNKTTCQLVDSQGYNDVSSLKEDACSTVKFYNDELYSVAQTLNNDDNLVSLINNEQ